MLTAPYGTWDSPVTPELMTRVGVRHGMPNVGADGSLTWIEGRPRESGRVVVVERGADGVVRDLVPAPFSARSRVHEDGGRPFVRTEDATWFVDYAEQKLRRVGVDGDPITITDGKVRLAELVRDPLRPRFYAVAEHAPEGATEHENGIVAVDQETGAVVWLARGHDFYAAPAVSPDGRSLAFLAWDHPHMPWDAAVAYVATVNGDGALADVRAIAGSPQGSAFQPTFAPDGQLYVSVEVDDRWRLHRVGSAGLELLVKDLDADVGTALWGLGTRVFGFRSEGDILAIAFDRGRSSIVRIDASTGKATPLVTEFALIGEMAVRGDDLLFIVGSAGGGSKVVHVDLRTGARTLLRDGLAGAIDAADTSEAEELDFPTGDGDTAHALYYAPRNARFVGPDGARPPLVVVAHGGPTGCANPNLQLSIQFWTTRGFAVLDVNYRGSTTYGRAYRDKLRGRWGLADVTDCVEGARHLARVGRTDPERAIIRGQSAGGYTVLCALTDHPDAFRAAGCLYGISDPRTLVAQTHKFESRYDRVLFGTGDDYERSLEDRAPINKVARVRTPVIFFQGLEDKVVPAAQTEGMHRALLARGIATEFHGFPGEQHGFRRAETIREVWTKELAFYRHVLGLPA